MVYTDRVIYSSFSHPESKQSPSAGGGPSPLSEVWHVAGIILATGRHWGRRRCP